MGPAALAAGRVRTAGCGTLAAPAFGVPDSDPSTFALLGS